MHTPSLTLYHYEYCGYCHRVRRAANALNIPLHLVDLDADPDARIRLIEERGRATAPVLGIPHPDGERLLGESTVIVNYLREHAEHLSAA